MDFQITPLNPPSASAPQQPFPPVNQPSIAPAPATGASSGSGKKKLLVIGGVLLLAVVALGYLFMRNGAFSESGVTMTIEAPAEITAGDLVEYQVKYANNSKTSLGQVKLSFFYPADALDAEAEAGQTKSITNKSFDIGILDAGKSGEQVIKAFVIGDKGDVKTARAVLTFIPSGITTTIKNEAILNTTITTLAVPITLVAPPTAISGQTISYLIDYRNTTSEDIANLRIKVTYPDGFKPMTYSPDPLAGGTVWEIPLLKSGDGARITIQGTLQGLERENKKISLVVQKQSPPDPGQYIDFEKAEASSVIASPLLPLTLSVNGSAAYVAHLGDTLIYEVGFRNNSNVDINSLTLTLKLEGDSLDFSSIDTTDSKGFFDSRTNTITWNASSIADFNLLRPNQAGSVHFRVRLKNSFGNSAVGIANSLIKAYAHLETQNIPSGLQVDKLFGEQSLITSITTAPAFTQTVTINDQQFGSSGPFPPKVDQKTAFTVNWNIVNPLNDLIKSKIVATLAPGITWENMVRTGQSGQSQPKFDSRSRTVTWDIGTVPGGSGLAFPALNGFFQVSAIPSSNQVGQPILLLKDIHFEAVDALTKEQIIRSLPELTTYRVGDSSLSGSVEQ